MFLRKEYYRRMGIYLNGGRKEEGLLFNFWKDNVSEAYKNHKEQMQEEQRKENAFKRHQKMIELQKRDPHAYNRLMAEKEAKETRRQEQLEREQKIAARKSTQLVSFTIIHYCLCYNINYFGRI